LLSARDDPFLPAQVLDEVSAISDQNRYLVTEFTHGGGHVGFVEGSPWRPSYYAENRVGDFLSDQLVGAGVNTAAREMAR
jgi:hypothetical protein